MVGDGAVAGWTLERQWPGVMTALSTFEFPLIVSEKKSKEISLKHSLISYREIKQTHSTYFTKAIEITRDIASVRCLSVYIHTYTYTTQQNKTKHTEKF